MQITRPAVAFLLAAILSACGDQAGDDGAAADLLLINGRVYTLNWSDPGPQAMEDKAWAEARLGPERILGAYAWRSLRETGSPLTFNSDNRGSDHDVFYGLHSAITRQDKQRQPEGGWFAEQAVNVDEAIRAYTNWSAYAAFREDRTGVLAPGRWADTTVIDIDPFVLAAQDPGLILEGRVLMTVVGGNVVYERE